MYQRGMYTPISGEGAMHWLFFACLLASARGLTYSVTVGPREPACVDFDVLGSNRTRKGNIVNLFRGRVSVRVGEQRGFVSSDGVGLMTKLRRHCR